MSMIRRGDTSGKIESYSQSNDEAIVCKACSRIIVSRENLKDGRYCPYCHNDVNVVLSDEELTDNNNDDIAEPC